MDDKRWWDIVSVGCPREVDHGRWDETLYAVLVKLDPDEIIRFDAWYDDRADDAYREDIGRSARIINGAVCDDSFYYFRQWLVGMGKVVYESALREPDTLANVVERGREYEVVCGAFPGARGAK